MSVNGIWKIRGLIRMHRARVYSTMRCYLNCKHPCERAERVYYVTVVDYEWRHDYTSLRAIIGPLDTWDGAMNRARAELTIRAEEG